MERIRNKLYLMTCYLFDHIMKPFYYAFLLHIVRVFLTPPHLTFPPLSWRQEKKHLFSQTLLVVIEEWHFELLLFWKSSSKCHSSITTSSVWGNRCVWVMTFWTAFILKISFSFQHIWAKDRYEMCPIELHLRRIYFPGIFHLN